MNKGAKLNKKETKVLYAEATARGETLRSLIEKIQEGLDEYPAGSVERQMQEELFRSSNLPDRLRRLQRSAETFSGGSECSSVISTVTSTTFALKQRP